MQQADPRDKSGVLDHKNLAKTSWYQILVLRMRSHCKISHKLYDPGILNMGAILGEILEATG